MPSVTTGSTQYLINRCVCGFDGFTRRRMNGILSDVCIACGVPHQVLKMSASALGRWYKEKYHAGIYTHSYEQDLEVARLRFEAYSGKLRGRVLDIGSGNGAFVNVCLEKGLDAYGQELSDYAKNGHIYTGPLEGVNFPTEYFEAVTVHDVLEHVPDPLAFLREVWRLIAPGSWLILEFPDFDCERHWKEIEHLWMFCLGDVQRLLERVGFQVVYYTRPVEGKFTFYCKRPEVKRTSILVPPGIGDSYWSIVKMRGMCRDLKLGFPEVWIAEAGDKRKRSFDWLQKIPWLKVAGYREHHISNPIFREAYMKKGRYHFSGVAGCDHFLAFNGQLRFGADLDQLIPQWESEWFPPLFESIEEREAIGRFRDRFGPYVVAYFVPHGMYREWLKDFGADLIVKGLEKIRRAGYQIVFMGAHWDRHSLQSKLAERTNSIDLSGETSMAEMFGLLRGSVGCIGWPAGNTIMSTVLRKPTVMFWNKYFHEGFWANSCPPESRGEWYRWTSTVRKPVKFFDEFLSMVR